MDISHGIKLVLVAFVLVIATVSVPQYYTFINNQVIKTFLLLIIIGVLFYDIHIGILVLTAFLIIIVQANRIVIEKSHTKLETFKSIGAPQHVPCDATLKQKEELSKDMIDYALDDKVRPYEVFIKMMTTTEQLDLASNAAILN